MTLYRHNSTFRVGTKPLRSNVGLAPTAWKRRPTKRARRKSREWSKVCDAREVVCGGCCEWPGCTETEGLHAHHFLPRGRGGRNVVENCRLLCFVHHERTHNHPLEAASLGLIHSSKVGGQS